MNPSFVSRYTRLEKLLGGLDIARLSGIEIGALDRPIAKRPGANVRYVDHADQATLRAKYAADPNVSQDSIVAVDAVWGENRLADCFAGQLFDYVIASHVIEHIPDMIGWLAEIADILRPDAHLILALPDRRYSFDVLRRETDLADLIDRHLRGARRPTPGQVFDNNANTVDFDHVRAWFSANPRDNLAPFVCRQDALHAARESQQGKYLDGHCSVFTARSLLALLDGLLDLRLLDFRLARFHVASIGTAEISLILQRQPPGADPQHARSEIARLLREGTDSEGLPLADPATPADPRNGAHTAALEAALAAMRASTSWRITAPVRTFARAARRMSGKMRR